MERGSRKTKNKEEVIRLLRETAKKFEVKKDILDIMEQCVNKFWDEVDLSNFENNDIVGGMYMHTYL